jgi:hypothetical protein
MRFLTSHPLLSSLVGLFLAVVVLGCSEPTEGGFRELGPGLELGEFPLESGVRSGKAPLTILRIDPARWDLQLVARSHRDEPRNLTAEEWADRYGLVAAINAGMYQTDFLTHVGYMKVGDHVNSRGINTYESVAAFGPVNDSLPAFRIFDLDDHSLSEVAEQYHTVIQNLRLIKRPGENRWEQQDKRWSEAALGEDDQGRVLFIFAPAAWSMHELNEHLLSLPLGLVSAQHLEGGPEAQLFVRLGDTTVQLTGSYEGSFEKNFENVVAWPIPNVIGVRPRQADKKTPDK